MSYVAKLPSVVENLPYEKYDAATTAEGRSLIRSTTLRRIEQSPMHARHDDLWPRPATEALDRGTAQHLLLFEPDRFDSEFIVAPHINRTTKAGKAAWADLEANAEGRTILRPATKGDPGEKLDAFRQMAEAARRNETFGAMLEKGKPEVSVFAEVGGLPCKVRVDWLCQHEGWTTVVNYKTTGKSADFGAFRRDAINYSYDFSEALYRMVLDKAVPGPERRYVFAVQETYPPYAVACYEIDEDWMAAATERVKRALSIWKACERSGQWPGYEDGIQPMSMPEWMADKAAREATE